MKFYDHHRQDARLVFQQEIRVRPKRLFEHILGIQNGELAYFQIPIDIRDTGQEEKVQALDIGAKKISQSQGYKSSKIIEEIDLHIERLQENYAHLSNAEIVQIQIAACEQAIDQAIRNGQMSLTIIHGVGKGVLKEEIHKLLKSVPEVRYFISDWMPKYGLGATQVFF
ncbi:MAG: Smr/MutS family protein [Taibaiella sp.]|nr:Smr/MutS family protein [Taibaiella sp.]